ncbi:MAG: phosphatase PAP2 family protein, partial [Rhizobiales bacterium]|nr:phosphatase PAP2 family protein [Hyphomicrobiales bacterium]
MASHPLSRRALREWSVLVLALLLVASVWTFVELAEEVVEGDTHRFDETLLLAMRNPADRSDPIGPGWVEEIGRDFTALGGIAVLVMIVLATSGYLVLSRKARAALWLMLATGSGMALSSLLKMGFDRPRPDLVPHGTIVYTASFPSSHSMMSAVVYLTIGALLARVQPRRRLKVYILSLAILLTLVVGISRVYLGVHWPTDVLAGWSLGTAWALTSWLVMGWLQDRRQVEPPDGDNTRFISVGPARGWPGVFVNVNRGKRSVVLDLRSDAGKVALRKLV